ncbi:MAG TPA: circularly permuted type 2 ATP-grasp protein [Acidimicrobiales bacterium]|jgi:uncharacterized circularly permuted ATP-grasp superfamily protein/uncharacterized alpha-E superfamily protein|nr:circularly permuted type 2 ATP-grasp protein [Acidimicrobiales bacterium]
MTIRVPAELLAAYRPAAGAYDEMVDTAGAVRPHWEHVGRALDELGLDELVRRRREVAKLLDDDGVTYNAQTSQLRTGDRWDLDPVPVLLSSEEWADIERGVIQRAELLNLVLSDLYGPRDLLRRGLLPPEIVFTHPGFLRPCDQILIPGGQQLFTAAMDLGRDTAGATFVLADRTQAPSGAGYALENRVVVSRVFPSLYRDSQVHRLAPFFRSLRSSLQAVAPPATDDPRIVVLTPGPWSETAFEHAYIASYLGYPLVEGADLTVRDGRVWLRSLGRLEPVDVILRRVDSDSCDPLELHPESQLGVPGLVEAVRHGTVSVVNTLGSGVLENPALLAFLPQLSEHLLGQPLRLPSVPTWWCGDPDSRRYVLDHLDRLVLKPIARGAGPLPARSAGPLGPGTFFGATLDAASLDALRQRVEARPAEWVGQLPLDLASAPTLGERGLEPRRALLRAFVVASNHSYAAMPGGLTRVAPVDGTGLVSNQAGALAKDTWVIASEPEKLVSFWLRTGPGVAASEPVGALSSRAAENLFWLGRYAERAEDVVRLLRVVHDRHTDFQHSINPAGSECLRALLAALTHVTSTYPGFVGDGADDLLAAPLAELAALVTDRDRPGTISYALHRMLDAAYAVRDQLSGDTWLVVGGLDREMEHATKPDDSNQLVPRAALSWIMTSLLAFAGLGAESMVRDPGWRFMDAGRRIERGIQLAALLRATVVVERDDATDSLLLESVLTAAESIITYRRRYRSHAQPETLLDLLVADAGNPRSLAYQLDQLNVDLAELPAADRHGRLSDAARHALEASTALRVADTGALAATAADGSRPALDAFLAHTIELLCRTADAIDTAHFTHQLPQRTMVGPVAAGVRRDEA